MLWSTCPVISPQDLLPRACGTDWNLALCVISSSRCDTSIALFMSSPGSCLLRLPFGLLVVIGNKWDGHVELQAHILYLLCPDLIARSTLRTALHHTRVSRASPSTQPRQSPPFPSPPFTSLPSSAAPSQQLPHNVLTMLPPLSTAALHSLRSADPLPSAVEPPKPWKRARKNR